MKVLYGLDDTKLIPQDIDEEIHLTQAEIGRIIEFSDGAQYLIKDKFVCAKVTKVRGATKPEPAPELSRWQKFRQKWGIS